MMLDPEGSQGWLQASRLPCSAAGCAMCVLGALGLKQLFLELVRGQVLRPER